MGTKKEKVYEIYIEESDGEIENLIFNGYAYKKGERYYDPFEKKLKEIEEKHKEEVKEYRRAIAMLKISTTTATVCAMILSAAIAIFR